MGLFFAEDKRPQKGRLSGFDRYREILERDVMSFFLAGLVTLAGFLPFGAGVFCAVATSSVLVLIPACVLGGLFAGPALYALLDLIFRTLRDAPVNWWENYRAAIRKNWRQALLPGVVLCLYLGFAVFAGMLFWWAEQMPSAGTIALFLASLLLGTMLLGTYWPQLVLFQQSGVQRLRNCVLFCVKYFWHTLRSAAILVAFWVLVALLLPWSLAVIPLIGMWYFPFLANLLLYNDLNEAFRIEEQIWAAFPEQRPVYDDEERFKEGG